MKTLILWPFKMVARFADSDDEIEFCGYSEADCMCKVADAEEVRGTVTWYSGVSNEDYEAGEYIGAENFIY